MEGTWEDERWSEKGEGVSLTELIFDSLNILKAVCHTCRENFQVSPVHMCQVPALYIKILYSTGGNLQSTPGDNLSCQSEKNKSSAITVTFNHPNCFKKYGHLGCQP